MEKKNTANRIDRGAKSSLGIKAKGRMGEPERREGRAAPDDINEKQRSQGKGSLGIKARARDKEGASEEKKAGEGNAGALSLSKKIGKQKKRETGTSPLAVPSSLAVSQRGATASLSSFCCQSSI